MVIPILAWLPTALQAATSFALIVAVGIVLQWVVLRGLAGRAARWSPFAQHVFVRIRPLFRFAILFLAITFAAPAIPWSAQTGETLRRLFAALFIALVGWMLDVALNIGIDRYETRLDLKASDNLLARKAVTQISIFRGALNILIAVLTISFALMTFDAVRQFGISLFASAGVAGLVAGLAARPLFENLIAGMQLALTQPLRLEDAVVINNEWGWVEEITSTYIVVRLWDLRRQIVPLSYLFQNPFTNWTRSSASIIGSVMLYCDFSLPVEEIRRKAGELAHASQLWDGKVIGVQVSDAREQTMEVRIIASAADSGKAWDLRCELRAKLIAFIRQEHPYALPRQRREDHVTAAEPQPPGPNGSVAQPLQQALRVNIPQADGGKADGGAQSL